MIERNEKKVFYDEYIDGTKDYYTITYGEIEDTFGAEKAKKIWGVEYDAETFYQILEE